MRNRIAVAVCALLGLFILIPSVALAQTPERPAIAVLFGVVRVQKVAFDETSGDAKGLSGAILAANVHVPVAKKVVLNLTVSGFKAEQTISDIGITGSIKTRDASIEPLIRFYTATPGKTRGFFEVGPSINFLKAEALVIINGITDTNESDTTTKLGAVLGGGVQIPLNGKISAELVGQYAMVPEWVTLNYSQLRVMGGITIHLGGK